MKIMLTFIALTFICAIAGMATESSRLQDMAWRAVAFNAAAAFVAVIVLVWSA